MTTRHWVLIAAAAVPATILLVRAIFDPTTRLGDLVAFAILAFAVRSLVNQRRSEAG